MLKHCFEDSSSEVILDPHNGPALHTGGQRCLRTPGSESFARGGRCRCEPLLFLGRSGVEWVEWVELAGEMERSCGILWSMVSSTVAFFHAVSEVDFPVIFGGNDDFHQWNGVFRTNLRTPLLTPLHFSSLLCSFWLWQALLFGYIAMTSFKCPIAKTSVCCVPESIVHICCLDSGR